MFLFLNFLWGNCIILVRFFFIFIKSCTNHALFVNDSTKRRTKLGGLHLMVTVQEYMCTISGKLGKLHALIRVREHFHTKIRLIHSANGNSLPLF